MNNEGIVSMCFVSWPRDHFLLRKWNARIVFCHLKNRVEDNVTRSVGKCEDFCWIFAAYKWFLELGIQGCGKFWPLAKVEFGRLKCEIG